MSDSSFLNYYFAKIKNPGYNELFYLRQLQQGPNADGGGFAGLGSVVKRYSGGLFGTSYILPFIVSAPGCILRQLATLKDVPADPTVQQPIASLTQTASISDDDGAKLGVGPFPSIPLNVSLNVDFSKASSLSYTFGAGTYYKYILLQYLCELHQSHTSPTGNAQMDSYLNDNALIDTLLIASNYKVTLTTDQASDIELQAQLSALSSGSPQGSVKFTSDQKTTLTAEVSGNVDYVVAIAGRTWDDCDPD